MPPKLQAAKSGLGTAVLCAMLAVTAVGINLWMGSSAHRLGETDAHVRIIRLPAWLFTNWAIGIVAFTTLAVVLGLRMYAVQRRRLQNEMRIAVRMGERNRIARELHDSLLQSFQGLMYRLQAIRNVIPDAPHDAVKMIDTALSRGDLAINEARRAIQQLRTFAGADSDLGAAITALGEDLVHVDASKALPRFEVIETGEPRKFDALIQDDIYCIAREAVRNAFHHANARHVIVEIDFRGADFLIHVRDDGVGMAARAASRAQRAGHWGLQGMRERALSFGGDVKIESKPGSGTVVALRVPAALSGVRT